MGKIDALPINPSGGGSKVYESFLSSPFIVPFKLGGYDLDDVAGSVASNGTGTTYATNLDVDDDHSSPSMWPPFLGTCAHNIVVQI
ncbi:hypothetical protein BLOT_003963 [Blomia tropicalis]|nr:hypothetical protein BLOT_003963 [Blomia tropicalis]